MSHAFRNFLIVASVYFILRMALWPLTGPIHPLVCLMEGVICLTSASLGIYVLMHNGEHENDKSPLDKENFL